MLTSLRHITNKESVQQNSKQRNWIFIYSFDTHFVSDIISIYSELCIERRSFEGIKVGFSADHGRTVS